MQTPLYPSLIRPFLKWPGGKFRQVNRLRSLLPNRSCFIEPFVGAGALFANTQFEEIKINDINADLINLYRALKNKGPSFIQEAQKLFCTKNNQEKMYYRLRDRFNKSDDLWEKALYFLYLNRHGYNGLCRYNLKGEYNVPFGDYRRPYFPLDELSCFNQRLQNVSFSCENYSKLFKRFLRQPHLHHTVFYCDPPYAPLSKTANFTGYAAHRFTLSDQQQLAELAKKLARLGALVIISNHDTPFTREIYQGATIYPFEVTRNISCQGQGRQKVGEIIACFSS